jgi:hypothetical protein
MATDHATVGNDYGQFCKVSEEASLLRDQTSGTVTIDCIEQIRDDFITLFNTDATHKFILEAIENWINGYRGAINGVIGALWTGPVALWLAEYVRDEVDSDAQTTQDIVQDWAERMRNDSEFVTELTVAISAGPTADADNNGDGTLTVVITEPIDGRPNEIVHNEKFKAVCRQDSFHGKTLPGSEVFEVGGSVHQGGISVPVKHAEGFDRNRVTNGGNVNYGNDVAGLPDDWDLVTGTAGVDITQETGAGDFIRDAAAFGIDGDGVAAEISIEQPEANFAGYSSQRRIKPKTFYQISAQIRTNRDAGIAAGDSFFIEFQGTGYAPTSADRIEIVGPDSAAYREEKATVRTPGDIPDDWVLAMRYNGTPAAGATVLVDDVVVQEFTVWEDAGIAVAITRGPAKEWREGVQEDYFLWETTNDESERMQRWSIRITDETTADLRSFPNLNRMLPSGTTPGSAAYNRAKAL